MGAVLLGGKTEGIESGMKHLLMQFQNIQLPVMAGLLALSVIFGEINIRKLKEISRQIRQTEDEECDRWEYEEEKVGAEGVIANILSQILCILVLSVSFSIRYIEDNHQNMLAVCIVFLACYVYDAFWQTRYVKLAQVTHPEKKGDPASRKFHQQWLESCDEAEKEIIYQSAYKAYIAMNTWIPALLMVSMLGHLFFDTGIMAIVIVAASWLVLTAAYLRSCVRLRGAKLRG